MPRNGPAGPVPFYLISHHKVKTQLNALQTASAHPDERKFAGDASESESCHKQTSATIASPAPRICGYPVLLYRPRRLCRIDCAELKAHPKRDR
jgi:hypothetical protein